MSYDTSYLNLSLTEFPASFDCYSTQYHPLYFSAADYTAARFNFNFNSAISIPLDFSTSITSYNPAFIPSYTLSSHTAASFVPLYTPKFIPSFISTYTPAVTSSFTQAYNSSSSSYLSKRSKSSSSSGYASMSRSSALTAAHSNPNLEKLTGGSGWSVSIDTFKNDIPYAKKGTGAILSKVSKQIGVNLTVTSALGTKNSPHQKRNISNSHYNSDNPKLDFGNSWSESTAKSIASKMMNTGYFEFANAEKNNGSNTWHIDAKIKDSAYSNFTALA